jgi:segregation and condensation protein A
MTEDAAGDDARANGAGTNDDPSDGSAPENGRTDGATRDGAASENGRTNGDLSDGAASENGRTNGATRDGTRTNGATRDGASADRADVDDGNGGDVGDRDDDGEAGDGSDGTLPGVGVDSPSLAGLDGSEGVDADVDDDEVEPVELLVSLARDGEIDPWDIDIVEVTDAFLDRLDATDLRTSGRALFYASVLLRMKGDALLAPEEPEADAESEPEPWELAVEGEAPPGGVGDGADGPVGPDPVAALESEMDRRLERKRARGSPETLEELVRELRDAERGSWWKSHREYDTSDSPRGYARGTQTLDYRRPDDLRMDGEPEEADVTGTAHREDIEATIDAVEGVLREQYDAGREEVLFAEVRDAGGSTVETFLALLFLDHRGVVHLQQDEVFGDLWIQEPATAARREGALAD